MFNLHHRQLSPETLSSDLAMARGPLRGIGGTGNCLFRASSSCKIVNIITSIDITIMSLNLGNTKKHLVASASTHQHIEANKLLKTKSHLVTSSGEAGHVVGEDEREDAHVREHLLIVAIFIVTMMDMIKIVMMMNLRYAMIIMQLVMMTHHLAEVGGQM